MHESAACGPAELADAITAFVVRKSGIGDAGVRAVVERAIADAGDDAVERLTTQLAQPAKGWSYYPANPLARLMHHRLAGVVLREPPVVTGGEHLAAVRDKALIIVSNHLSHSDANVIDVLLQQSGHDAIARRLAVIAGPKVRATSWTTRSSSCLWAYAAPR